jgi:predicted DNA-binding protein (UPF0251 family)
MSRPRKLTDQEIETAKSLRAEHIGWKVIAARMEVDRTTLWRAAKRVLQHNSLISQQRGDSQMEQTAA